MKIIAWNTRGNILPTMVDGLIILIDLHKRIAFEGIDIAILPEFGSRLNSFGSEEKWLYLRRNEISPRKLNLAVFVANGTLSEEIHDPVHGVLSCIWKTKERDIRIVAIHSQLNYVKSVQTIQNRLVGWTAKLPLTVAGDFNMNAELKAGGNSAAKFNVFWQQFQCTLDSVYHAKRGILPSKADPATLRSSSNNTMIDYIFVSREHFLITQSEVDCSAQQSDHFAVTAELELK